MRNLVLSLLIICTATAGAAFEIEAHARFGAQGARELRVISTADIEYFEPFVEGFLSDNPEVAIDYTVASSSELMRALYDEGEAFDLALSSAMDLQTKLANDGLAQRHRSAATQALPDWAVWNDMLFAFTQEPATIAVSKAGFEGLPVPRSRQEMITLLRQHPERFRGRVDTYNIEGSCTGYLFATQDTRASDTFWRLTEVMGGLGARLYCCTSEMIAALTSGELLIAYNVLGSYAVNHEDRDAYEIILPEDFVTVMMRTGMIPHNAPSPDLAALLMDHLLADAHQNSLTRSGLDLNAHKTSLHRIRIGPGLLVFLDQLKKTAFLTEWRNAILQE